MAVASGFRYSDEEWAQIYALLPRYIRPDSAALRKEIEERSPSVAVHCARCHGEEGGHVPGDFGGCLAVGCRYRKS